MTDHSTHAANLDAAANYVDRVRNALVEDPSETDVNEQLHLGESAAAMRRTAGILRKRSGASTPPALDLDEYLGQPDEELRDAGLGDPFDGDDEEEDDEVDALS